MHWGVALPGKDLQEGARWLAEVTFHAPFTRCLKITASSSRLFDSKLFSEKIIFMWVNTDVVVKAARKRDVQH